MTPPVPTNKPAQHQSTSPTPIQQQAPPPEVQSPIAQLQPPAVVPPAGITPVSAPPQRKLNAEEKRQRFAELRQRMNRSQIEVTPPAGKVGYWAPMDDTREMGRLSWLGFQVVHDDPKAPIWKANGLKEDGRYIIGDVILVEIDTDTYEFYQQEYVNTSENMRANAKATFISDAEATGVPAFEVAKRGGR